MSRVLAQFEQAERLLAGGDAAGALAIAQRLLPKGPGDPGINSLAARALLRLGRYPQAEFHARRALLAEPGAGDLALTLSETLFALRRPTEAMDVLRRAAEEAPTHVGVRVALANALSDLNDAEAAAAHLEAALAQGPDAQASTSYAGVLLALGRADDCVAFLRKAIAQFPDEPLLAGALPAALAFVDSASPDMIAEAHRAYGRTMDRLHPGVVFRYPQSRNPERRLRVALVSPDLRQHSVSYFVEPILELHDRGAFEFIAYSTTRLPDTVSERLKAHAAGWVECANLSDMQIAQRINADRVDIAIDLAGHTMSHNLPAFHLKPAPVQVTYCGYPDTTGLSQMDFRIVDSLTDPPRPEVDARATERLWRLDPCFLCYRPPRDAPSPRRDTAASPTFGSFNAARKINARAVGVWSRVLRETPGSRLILKSFDFTTPGAVTRLRDLFASHGIATSRLEFLGAAPSVAEHLALYARVDVALDAFPYNGTTTTCESLWMGVPVVALEGEVHAARVGVSLLTNAGVPELIAPSEDAFVSLASGLAQDSRRLDSYRASLRGRIAASPVCDAPAFASRFQTALREMWRRYCSP